MPMVEITTTPGALDDGAMARLAAELSAIALELEAAPLDFSDLEHVQALTWCFVNEQEILINGRHATRPLYRVTVTIPAGAPGVFGPLARRGRAQLVDRVTDAVLSAEGTKRTPVEAHRVWVHLRDLDDGHWGSFGRMVTVTDLAKYCLGSPDDDDEFSELRRAAITSFRANTMSDPDSPAPAAAAEGPRR